MERHRDRHGNDQKSFHQSRKEEKEKEENQMIIAFLINLLDISRNTIYYSHLNIFLSLIIF